jgi:apolipoprotein N-acyltransferase
VKKLLGSGLLQSRYPLAVASGLVLAASFPKPGIAGFAWVAPGLMLLAALGLRGAEPLRVGYVAALTHYLASLYWLLFIPFRWHGIPIAPAVGWLLLGAFLAIFPAVWIWLVNPQRAATSGPAQTRPLPPGSILPFTGLPKTWGQRVAWALLGAAAWVAMEMILARIFSGFPWNLLGTTQYRLIPLIQVASFTGVYGVSFLLVWFSLSLLSAGLLLIRAPDRRLGWIGEIFLPVMVIAILFNLGFRHTRNEVQPGRTVRITCVQPSIPQTLIWDPERDDERFAGVVRLTEQALTNKADIVIWPESAVPKLIRYDTNTFNAITGLARKHKVWIILGSDDAERRPGSPDPQAANYFNSSFLISPEGRLETRYIKRNLVIFGEYVPLRGWLPFLKFFTPVEGGFTAGTRSVPFDLGDLDVQTSVLICFEDVFPQVARTDVEPRTDFLVNLTNDGWFGRSAAQWQQATTALFRTVENGVPLVRVCNNGLTCWIDRFGRLRQILRDTQGSVYGEGFMLVELPLPPAGLDHALTFYTRHGDWFGWGCCAVTGVMLVSRGLSARRPAGGDVLETGSSKTDGASARLA